MIDRLIEILGWFSLYGIAVWGMGRFFRFVDSRNEPQEEPQETPRYQCRAPGCTRFVSPKSSFMYCDNDDCVDALWKEFYESEDKVIKLYDQDKVF